MTLKAVFFDVDGVLAHGYHFEKELQQPWDLDLEQDLGLNRSHFLKEYIFESFIPFVLLGQKTMKETLEVYLSRSDVEYEGDANSVIQYYLEKDSNINQELMAYIQKIAQQKNVKLYIATNQSHERANHLWQNYFSSHFEKIYYSADFGVSKESPEFFDAINKELGFEKGNVLFFDDNPGCVEQAKKAGWAAVKYKDISDFLTCEAIQSLLNDSV